MDWGDVPTWLGAIGTVGTLVAAIFVVSREQRAAARNDDERRRNQASQVAAWARIEPGGRIGGLEVQLYVRNASKQPVYDVLAAIQDGGTGEGVATDSLAVLPPGETEVRAQAGALRHFLRDSKVTGSPAVTMSFRDSAGQAWQRDLDGRLIPLDHLSTPGMRRAIARRLRRGQAEAEET